MGKKGKGKTGDLGRALLRDRFGSSRSKRSSGEASMVRKKVMFKSNLKRKKKHFDILFSQRICANLRYDFYSKSV